MADRALSWLAIPGSLRRASLNRALLASAQSLAPANVTVTVHDLRDIPLYDGDVEAGGVPEGVTALKDAIAQADGVIIATPEYNRSIPGVLKNALDWVSRKPSPLPGTPCAVVSASPGGGGASMAQPVVKMVLHTLGADLPPLREFAVKQAMAKFEGGSLTDSDTRERFAALLSAFAEWIRRRPE